MLQAKHKLQWQKKSDTRDEMRERVWKAKREKHPKRSLQDELENLPLREDDGF
jgi:hypothetical protein